MALNPESKYPSRRAYVLKMRGDATPREIVGRLENLVTGQLLEFASAGELVDSIAHDLATIITAQSGCETNKQPKQP